MALVPCLSCGLLRTVSDADAAIACPVCGWKPGDPVTPVPDSDALRPVEPLPEQVVTPPPEPPSHQNRWLIATLAIAAIAVLVAMVAWPSDNPTVQPDSVAVESITLPPPVPAEQPAPTIAEPAAPVIFPVGVPVIAFTPGPPTPAVIRLSRADEDFELDRMGDKNYVKLTGVVHKLVLRGLTDGAILDARELRMDSLSVSGVIDRGATLLIQSPQTVVTFRSAGGVSGDSRVDLHVGSGSVTFAYPGSDGARVSGGARVTITARSVSMGNIEGENTIVKATVQPPGVVRFNKLDGGAKFHYWMSDPTDPFPKVTAGSIDGGAEFKHIDPPEPAK